MTRRRGLIAVGVFALLASAPAGAVGSTAHADATVRRTVLLGYSVEGRPITAIEAGDPDTRYKTLVVGCIHGNEPAGIAIADRLASTRPPAESDLWIVADLNPDGVAAGTRGNAHSVDLNRNFPSRWQRLSGTSFSGPRPLSEPATRIAYRLIEHVRPVASIWFHQHLDLVDDSTGNRALERRFARAAGLRLAPLAREPGSAVTLETHRLPSHERLRRRAACRHAYSRCGRPRRARRTPCGRSSRAIARPCDVNPQRSGRVGASAAALCYRRAPVLRKGDSVATPTTSGHIDRLPAVRGLPPDTGGRAWRLRAERGSAAIPGRSRISDYCVAGICGP